MRLLIILLLFVTASAYGQTGYINSENNLVSYSTVTIETTNECLNNNCNTILKLKSDGTQLAKIFPDGVIYWIANLTSTNVSDTLGASGVEAISRITVPTSIGTQRIVQVDDIAIIFSTANYTAEFRDDFSYPITIRKNSDNSVQCYIYRNTIVWNIAITNSMVGRVGTTRIKRITLP